MEFNVEFSTTDQSLSVDFGVQIGGCGSAVCKASIDDSVISADKTWSSQKINSIVGDIESALDGIIAIQNELIGGGKE